MLTSKEDIILEYISGTLIKKLTLGEVCASDETRKACCKLGPEVAYSYALNIDKGPNSLTRNVSSERPDYAIMYALHIDKKEHTITRKGACANPEWAYLYAESVDQKPHKDTETSAAKLDRTKISYELFIEKLKNIIKSRT